MKTPRCLLPSPHPPPLLNSTRPEPVSHAHPDPERGFQTGAHTTRDGSGAMSASARTVASGGGRCGTHTCGSRPKMQSIAADCAPMARMLHHRRVYDNVADRRSSGWRGTSSRRTRSLTTAKTSSPQWSPRLHASAKCSSNSLRASCNLLFRRTGGIVGVMQRNLII